MDLLTALYDASVEIIISAGLVGIFMKFGFKYIKRFVNNWKSKHFNLIALQQELIDSKMQALLESNINVNRINIISINDPNHKDLSITSPLEMSILYEVCDLKGSEMKGIVQNVPIDQLHRDLILNPLLKDGDVTNCYSELPGTVQVQYDLIGAAMSHAKLIHLTPSQLIYIVIWHSNERDILMDKHDVVRLEQIARMFQD